MLAKSLRLAGLTLMGAALGTQAAALEPARLLHPAGTGNVSPRYQWEQVAGVPEYGLWVANPAGGAPLINVVLSASAVCLEGACSYRPAWTLEPGVEHTWWVQSRDGSGSGPWSAEARFTTTLLPSTPAVPGTTRIEQPGPVDVGWAAADGSSEYRVWFETMAGDVLVDEWIQAAESCVQGRCLKRLMAPSAGLQAWWLQSRNAYGTSGWSNRGLVVVGGMFQSPVAMRPSAKLPTLRPTFEWLPSEGAVSYRVVARSAQDGTPLLDAAVSASACALRCTYAAVDPSQLSDSSVSGTCDRRCAYTPPQDVGSNLVWWVEATNAAGAGVRSAAKRSKLQVLPPPANLPPTCALPAGPIDLRHNEDRAITYLVRDEDAADTVHVSCEAGNFRVSSCTVNRADVHVTCYAPGETNDLVVTVSDERGGTGRCSVPIRCSNP